MWFEEPINPDPSISMAASRHAEISLPVMYVAEHVPDGARKGHGLARADEKIVLDAHRHGT